MNYGTAEQDSTQDNAAIATSNQSQTPKDAGQQLDADIAFLESFGHERAVLTAAQNRAHLFGVSASDVLLFHGVLTERDYFRCLAFHHNLPFEERTISLEPSRHGVPDPETLARAEQLVSHVADPVTGVPLPGRIHIAPGRQVLDLMARNRSALSGRASVVTRTANRIAVQARHAASLTQKAIYPSRLAGMNAERSMTAVQAVVLLVLIQVLLYLAIFSPGTPQLLLHIMATGFYLACIAVRGAAAIRFRRTRPPAHDTSMPESLSDRAALPRYAVLVPMRQEAGQVPDLVGALSKLIWPKERLAVRLICDADDGETINAVWHELEKPGLAHMQLVVVPVSKPRTKPKVLNWTLQLIDAERLVIYDAEDRPHPGQLMEAHNAFAAGGPDLACLQAPLAIHNTDESWLSKMFAVEYSSLFDGLLPFLASIRAPLPLGGTSNHFKVDALRECGAWDAWNVTEDADLGMRLARTGYRTDVLRSPTWEEAPIHFTAWRNQRTRWFKGWMQTWLVHMRNPVALSSDLGFRGTIMFHVMITGMICCALVHPLLLGFLAYWTVDVWNAVAASQPVSVWVPIDLATVLAGYITFAWLAWRTLKWRNRGHLATGLVWLPVYWMALSIAAWRALLHLLIKPHEWEKTEHRLRR
ncbi:glycosyltransferase family 2 protein [Ahrensia sp. R2A130]|uniref:glycosyltransferase family 2 protein n=1 Tax=Ahrensia sp. R2A130 TaxID=744979 RepID=UPI0001E0E8B0|nr:glycosyltransferase family 2 protein [Ahrensia sp. R2A130]EFL89145.1 glycosyl transferase, group 2 family [Ahrensia sp. R2A130]